MTLRPLLAAAAGALVGACASTTVVEQWQSPDHAAGPLKRVLVVGVTRQAATRRVFEDEFVRQLKTHGADAAASYVHAPEDGELSDQVKVESRLFDARSAALVWAAESEVFAPTDVKKDSADFAATLIKALAARKLI